MNFKRNADGTTTVTNHRFSTDGLKVTIDSNDLVKFDRRAISGFTNPNKFAEEVFAAYAKEFNLFENDPHEVTPTEIEPIDQATIESMAEYVSESISDGFVETDDEIIEDVYNQFGYEGFTEARIAAHLNQIKAAF